jgi:hypothetical protein
MAMSCPTKKALIKNKKEQKSTAEKTKKDATYAKIVKDAVIETNKANSQQAEAFASQTGFRALLMILDAHVQNIIVPGSYNTHLNKTLELNNLQPIQFQTLENSEELFKHDLLGNAMETLRGLQTAKDPEKSKATEEEHEMIVDDDGSSTGTETEEEEDTDDDQSEPDDNPKVKDAGDLGVTLHVNKDEFEASKFGPRRVYTCWSKEVLKFTLSQTSSCSEGHIKHLLNNGLIRASMKDVRLVITSVFRKIRNGRVGSPPKGDSKRSK